MPQNSGRVQDREDRICSGLVLDESMRGVLGRCKPSRRRAGSTQERKITSSGTWTVIQHLCCKGALSIPRDILQAVCSTSPWLFGDGLLATMTRLFKRQSTLITLSVFCCGGVRYDTVPSCTFGTTSIDLGWARSWSFAIVE